MSAVVLFEDATMLAVEKEVGVSTIRERDPSVPCLHTALEAARGERLFIVHRLDKEVSGVVVFARDAAAHRALSMSFEARRVEKHYAALAYGDIEQDRSITLALREFGSGRTGADAVRGKPSETRVRVVARGNGVTRIDAQPVTGRRHQIRAHLYAIGHPLVGDQRYGDKPRAALEPRLFLHAAQLLVPHPTTGAMMTISSQVPVAFVERAR